ncbi:MAG: hypothetical protein CMM58_02050 [Rhodospirillaceae bacterium]|nr:hypothetical protein [Rhodospirillaceae bacterium]|tara:strand:+ start:303 stop:1289 length:987 start_codon:yes stop_codon:yes gene_type:complete
MEIRSFGRTELKISVLTLGCGAVGGLMTQGRSVDQDRAVAWARDNGINHFDTAPSYGDTISETNLGRALGRYRQDIVVSTKIGFSAEDFSDIYGAARRSITSSLKRLRQDHIDILQLHNTVDNSSTPGTLTLNHVINDVLPAFSKLKSEGMARYIGFTAKGDTTALHKMVETEQFDSSQVFYNLLVPSAGEKISDGYPAQDYRQLLQSCQNHKVGTIGVRILAGGALSGSLDRHPLGMKKVDPIGSGDSYSIDVNRAVLFKPLVDLGYASTLPELSVRYSISSNAISTVEIGIATLEELAAATQAVNKGVLPEEALAHIRTIQSDFVG